MTLPRCECCGAPSLVRVAMAGIEEVDLGGLKRPTPAQIHAAPCRPSQWCEACAARHQRWLDSKAHRSALEKWRRALARR